MSVKKRRKISLSTKLSLALAGFIVVIGFLVFRGTVLFQNQPLPTIPSSFPIYSGILPCADCSGLETGLLLHPSDTNPQAGTYSLKQVYQGKNVNPLEETGTYVIVDKTVSGKEASVYRLTTDGTNAISYYMEVDSMHLQMLDSNGNEIVTPFNITLTKQQ